MYFIWFDRVWKWKWKWKYCNSTESNCIWIASRLQILYIAKCNGQNLIDLHRCYCHKHQLIVCHFYWRRNSFIYVEVSIHLLDKLLGRWAISTLNPQTRITHLLFFLISCFSFYLKKKQKFSIFFFRRVLAFKMCDINSLRVVTFFFSFYSQRRKKLHFS